MRIIENKILVEKFLKFQKLIFFKHIVFLEIIKKNYFLWFIILRQNTKIKKLIDNF